MVLLGKESISEPDAAAAFVREILGRVRDQWQSLEDVLDPVLQPDDRAILNDPWAKFEFALASLAVESQALANLLPPDQSDRVLAHVFTLLDTEELEGAGVEGFNAYREAWRRGLERNEPPFEEVASLLFDRVGFQASVEMAEARLKDPLLLMAVSTAILIPGQGWWKATLGGHNLVE